MIQATITLLTTQDGGRTSAIFTGYRPQFYVDGEDFECRSVETIPNDRGVWPGETANVRIVLSEFANESLRERLACGQAFELHEGARAVAHGVITGLTADL